MPDHPPESAPRGSPSQAGVEWARLLGCLGIVAFHQGGPLPIVGHAGLPMFAMLTTAMAARSARGRDWPSFRRGRLRRLLWPWLVWSVFYAGVQCTLAALSQQPLWSRFDVWMLVTGTYPHLWYLPFAAAAALLAGRFGNRGRAWQWLVAGAVCLPLSSWLLTQTLPIVVLSWVFVLPAALLGVGLARAPLGNGVRAAPIAFLLAAALGCLAAASAGLHPLLIQYAVAVPALALLWSLPLYTDRWTRRLAAATLGI
jgi:hypothetical protein